MIKIPLKRIIHDFHELKANMGGVFSKGLPKFSLEQFPELTKLFSRAKTNRKINQTTRPMPENSQVQDEEENRTEGSNSQLWEMRERRKSS